MGGVNIPLPALQARPPEQQNPLEQYARIQQIRMQQQQMQQQQQIAPLQIQAAQQENQQRQTQIQQTQAMNDAYKNALTPGQPGANGQAGIPTFNQEKALASLAQSNAGSVIPSVIENFQKLDKNAGDIQKLKDEHNSAATKYFADGAAMIRSANYDPAVTGTFLAHATANGYANEVQQFQQQLQQAPDPQAAIKQIVDHVLSQSPETEKGSIDAQKAQQEQTTRDSYLKNPQQLIDEVDAAAPPAQYKALNQRTKAQVQFAMRNGDIESAKAAIQKASEEVGGIEKETNPQVQQGKINVAYAEGKAKQLMQGLAEPVYAVDSQGNKTLTNKTAALQGGAKVILPVTEKGVEDDIMLINRLGDVRQKIARYEQSMSKDLPAQDKGNIAALLGTRGLKLGVSGTEIPLDRLNSALQSENLAKLSPQGRQALVAYRNAREAMVGYQRVLSGSGRSSEQAMELNIQALPDPSISDAKFASESFKQFKENLGIVGQGLPKIPGIKSPDEVEQSVTNPQPQGSNGQRRVIDLTQ